MRVAWRRYGTAARGRHAPADTPCDSSSREGCSVVGLGAETHPKRRKAGLKLFLFVMIMIDQSEGADLT